MIQFEYQVLKPFSIYKDSTKIKRIARTAEEKKSGMSYTLTARYVDYESIDNKIKQDTFTIKLCKLQYLKLIKKIKISKKK